MSWPQVEPANCLMLIFDFAFATVCFAWLPNVYIVSKIIPRSLGSLSSLTGWLSRGLGAEGKADGDGQVVRAKGLVHLPGRILENGS